MNPVFKRKNIGLIGMGTVGGALLNQIISKRAFLRKNFGLELVVKKVCDLRPELKKKITGLNISYTTDAFQLIDDKEIDIVIELIGGISPAKEYILKALRKGKQVVTANKALLAQEGREIFSLARKYNRPVMFEAAVAGAIPIIKSISENLVFSRIKNIYAILNGTTNFILSEMYKNHRDFKEALRKAQEKGFAERNPELDIKGIDSLHKIALLCFLCFGYLPDIKKIYVEGIEKISSLDILYTQELNFTIKLLAIVKKLSSQTIEMRVHPTLISSKHPLSQTPGVFNSIYIDTEDAGSFLFSGIGAGGKPTSATVLSDIVNLSFQKDFFWPKNINSNLEIKQIAQLSMRYYIRFMAVDKPGVLAKISKILAQNNISIASVTQKEVSSSARTKFVPIIMLTHKAQEGSLRKAVKKIDELSVIKSPTQVIRIEDL